MELYPHTITPAAMVLDCLSFAFLHHQQWLSGTNLFTVLQSVTLVIPRGCSVLPKDPNSNVMDINVDDLMAFAWS